MPDGPGSNAYFSVPDAYDNFMGRFSRPLAQQFVHSVPLNAGNRVLDLGCGPGALTGELVNLLGAANVTVLDPSRPFLETCLHRYPGISGEVGAAEDIPFEDSSFDAVVSQLVIHFFVDLDRSGKEMLRVTKPGGWIAACTWVLEKMDLLHMFDEAAMAVTGQVPLAPPSQQFRTEGAVRSYLSTIGLSDVTESTLTVNVSYGSFDDLWGAYQAGIGPLGAWMKQQSEVSKGKVRDELARMLGNPSGEFTLKAVARSARGRTPG